jgi:hypothetical protein
LCCRLLPVREIGKGANTSCRFQKFRKGCTVHGTARMPPACALWSCRWLVNDDTADLSRPDRAHYVIDLMPDFITLRDNATGTMQNVEVAQVWVDPSHRDAHRDPALRRWMLRRAEQGIATLVRFGAFGDAITIYRVIVTRRVGTSHNSSNGARRPL